MIMMKKKLKSLLELCNMVFIFRSFFHENKKYYILTELMLIRQVRQKCVIFVIIGILQRKFKFHLNVCNDVLMMSTNLSNIAISKN